MPREIFGHVTDPPVSLGSRKWYTVPLSLAAHVAAIIPVVLVPLLATDLLPAPHEFDDVFVVTPPSPPEPPAAARPPERKQPVSDPAIPPIEAPSGITKEPANQGEPLSDPKGVIDGIVDGVGTVITDPGPAPPPPVVQKPVHVGGHIRRPEKIRDVPPVYPTVALHARVQGFVILEAIIGVDGRVQNLRVLRSSPLLDQAALDAVRQWEYSPTTLNGVPVPVVMTVTVSFTLGGK